LAWYNLQIDLVLLVGDSLGLTLGAALDMPFEDRQDELRALGAMLGMLLY
jgi:hypothetical protein